MNVGHNIYRLARQFLLLSLLSSCQVEATAAELTLYFYNPESNINNYTQLKKEVDAYFAKQGSFVFQPFSQKETFESIALVRQNALFLLSSWHYTYINKSTPLSSELVGMLQGNQTQEYVLVSQNNLKDIPQLSGKIVAASGSVEFSRTLLQASSNRKGNRQMLSEIQILIVPKDIDALLSVNLGVADAALVTETNFNNFLSLNRKNQQAMHIIGRCGKKLLPIVAAKKGTQTADTARFLSAILNMRKDKGGRKCLRMLGLDGWKPCRKNDEKGCYAK